MTTNERLLNAANTADEELRAMCHVLINTSATPAPVVYDLMNPFAGTASKLEQLAGHLARGLVTSLSTYEVYDQNRDPAESAAMAEQELLAAARHLHAAMDAFNRAQLAINLQGHNGLRKPTPGAPEQCPKCQRDDLIEWESNGRVRLECASCDHTWTRA